MLELLQHIESVVPCVSKQRDIECGNQQKSLLPYEAFNCMNEQVFPQACPSIENQLGSFWMEVVTTQAIKNCHSTNTA